VDHGPGADPAVVADLAVVEGKAFVGETLACEATMMAQIVKNKE